HSQLQLYAEGPEDKLITFLSVDDMNSKLKIPPFSFDYLKDKKLETLFKSEEAATRIALKELGRPSLTLHFPEISPYTIGQFIYMMEMATAISGEILGINAFDQPGVERGKILTKALMGDPSLEKEKDTLTREMKKYEESSCQV
ncbi:MAG TPA: glucose-6-phosphate isomerase, partial [bacterium]|nr:glucose-6-phosphate isomerase [bacterium]